MPSNYRLVIAARSKKVILKQITELVFDYFGGPKNAAAAIKNFSKSKNKIANFAQGLVRDVKTRLLIHLLSFYTGESVSQVTANSDEVLRSLFKLSSRNEDKQNLDESYDTKFDIQNKRKR